MTIHPEEVIHLKILILIGSAILLLNTVLCLCCAWIAADSDHREEFTKSEEKS